MLDVFPAAADSSPDVWQASLNINSSSINKNSFPFSFIPVFQSGNGNPEILWNHFIRCDGVFKLHSLFTFFFFVHNQNQ